MVAAHLVLLVALLLVLQRTAVLALPLLTELALISIERCDVDKQQQ